MPGVRQGSKTEPLILLLYTNKHQIHTVFYQDGELANKKGVSLAFSELTTQHIGRKGH